MKILEQYFIVDSPALNGDRKLFGGILMQWVDETTTILGRKFTHKNVTTKCFKDFIFYKPAFGNDVIVVRAEVVQTGHTSITVQVESFIEDLSEKRTRIQSATVILVALDEEGRPTAVPAL